jgi:gamma-butyrobetaine dioxygenase
MSELHVVSHTGQVLTVEVDGRPFDLHAMWLRDACTCAECRRPTSNERLFEASVISPDIALHSARTDSRVLHVRASDGHRIRVLVSWLIDHVQTSDRRASPALGRELWDATTAGIPLTFDFDVIDLEAERRIWLELLQGRGILSFGKNRYGERDLREVAAAIGPIRQTNYGDVWTIDATIEPVTAVDSERALRVHTDLPYLDNPPGVQLMMVENHGVEGGESTFVDGFAVAEYIRATDPDAWQLLTTIDFAYPFVREDIEMHGRAPLVGLHNNGEYALVRRAPDLVGAPFVSAHDTPKLYRAVHLWNGLLDGGKFERRARIGSGNVVVWDNHRILHGRTGFRLGSRGRRVLRGCYVDADHLRNEHALAIRRAHC